MVDYRINLAKTVTSTSVRRRKIYHGMIVYLAVCAAGLVYVAARASSNVVDAHRDNRQRNNLVKSGSNASEFSKSFYKNPDAALDEMQLYAADLALVKSALADRTHFLPVMKQLFSKFPQDIAVESLEASAEKNSIIFGLVGPSKSIKAQQSAWKQNAELNGLVLNIKQVTGEVRVVGDLAVNFVKFECVLKK